LGNSIWIFSQKTGYGMAICGENVCELETQTIIQWTFEYKVVLILYCMAGASQTCPHVPRWLYSLGKIPISLHPQIMAGAPKPAKASTVARIAHRPLN
jgi:hypothetical protein